MNFLGWFEANSGAVTGISSLVLTVITACYAYLTWRLLKESQEMRLAAVRPELAIYTTPAESAMSFVMLRLENVGRGPAYNLRLATNIDFNPEGRRTALREIGLFRKGLSYFAPGQRIEHFLVSLIGKLEELKKTPLEITAVYCDSAGQEYSRTFAIDFGELENLSRIGKPPLHELADLTKQIQRDIHNIATGFSKPHILSEPAVDYERRLESEYLAFRIDTLSDEDRSEVEALVSKKQQAAKSTGEEMPTSCGEETHNTGGPSDG
jgi:hypothetical protein